jgi:hypothetical protein
VSHHAWIHHLAIVENNFPIIIFKMFMLKC